MGEEGTTEQHIVDPGKEARAAVGIPIVPAFDGFRAYAILGVVIIHLLQISGVATSIGEVGERFVLGTFGRAVEVLFVVSGFVVFLPTAARRGEFGRIVPYAIRRGARLLPAFWLIIVISILLVVLFHPTLPVIGEEIGTPSPTEIFLNLTATAVPVGLFTGDTNIGLGIDPPLWTLSAELAFYLVLPLVAGIFFRRPWIGLAASAAVTLLWSGAFSNVDWLMRELGIGGGIQEGLRLKFAALKQLPAWAFSFGLGMAGATLWVRLNERGPTPGRERLALAAIPAALLGMLASAWILGDQGILTREPVVWSMVFSLSLACLMLAITFVPAGWQRPFTARRVRKLGDISYGIYLSHFVFITMFVWAFDLSSGGSLGDLLVLSALVVPPSVLYGYLSARFLEQPIRLWARKYGRRDEV